jgi:hypothetical protein
MASALTLSLVGLLKSKSIDFRNLNLVVDNAKQPTESLLIMAFGGDSIPDDRSMDTDDACFESPRTLSEDPFMMSSERDLQVWDLCATVDSRWDEKTETTKETKLICPNRSTKFLGHKEDKHPYPTILIRQLPSQLELLPFETTPGTKSTIDDGGDDILKETSTFKQPAQLPPVPTINEPVKHSIQARTA